MRDRVSYLGRGEPLPPSLPLVKALARGESGRAPLLCIQALQEQRTDIRPKNTQLQPHQLAVETMRASHCSSCLLELWWPPHADSVFRKVCSHVCACWVTSCFSTTSHATCSPSKPLKGTSRVSISHSTCPQNRPCCFRQDFL